MPGAATGSLTDRSSTPSTPSQNAANPPFCRRSTPYSEHCQAPRRRRPTPPATPRAPPATPRAPPATPRAPPATPRAPPAAVSTNG
ncbi:hypothetical protein BTO20_00590 [Mycobacterium dioxanotrophicus]|uniref:Uncharacterized protein n=1 Tax=Mycobacterium dioxanotrophicus TaxID=482462 RepID=A0A1Y0BWM5_9MYCO|nr:hypothetical protein BTO20_00590 [Mycobacterium dioxanotrophicus]